MESRLPTVAIDARLSGIDHAGIGRYQQELLRGLIKDTSHHWLLFFYSTQQASLVLNQEPPANAWNTEKVVWFGLPCQLKKQRLRSNVEVVIAPIKHYGIAEQLIWPMVLARFEFDLLHVPHFNVPVFTKHRLVVTIHDLLWHSFKTTKVTTLPLPMYFLKYTAYRWVAARAIKHATAIMVPAKNTQTEVTKFFPDSSDKVVVTTEGVHTSFFSKKAPSPHPKPWLVYVGSLYPHKNIIVVLKALQDMPELTLKLVGSRNIFLDKTLEQATKLGVDNQIEWLGKLTDQQLVQVLQTATALVQPSTAEGFGLTGLEAMAAGCPVIASDIPIFQELYQPALLFKHDQPDQLVAAVVQAQLKRSTMIKQGRRHAKLFSWGNTVQQTLGVYDQSLTN